MPASAGIVDLGKAPVNNNGLVEFGADAEQGLVSKEPPEIILDEGYTVPKIKIFEC